MYGRNPLGRAPYGRPVIVASAAAAAPVSAGDFPNPGRRRDYSLLNFALAVPLVLATLGAPVKPAGAASFDLPRRLGAPVQTQQLGAPLALLSQTVAAPFAQTDWPVPKGRAASIELRTFLNPVELQLAGKDTFFGAPGQPPANLDWPVPRGAVGSIALRGFVQSTNLSITTAPPTIPPTNYDWPNPRGRVAAIDLRTFIGALDLRLAGKDQFFGAAGQPPANVDWPVPRAYRGTQYAAGDRSLTLFGSAALPSFNSDWPVPRGYQRAQQAVSDRSLALLTLGVMPPSGLDWPVPSGYRTAPHLLPAGLRNLPVASLPAPVAPSANMDWPLPRGATYAVSLRTFTHLAVAISVFVETGTPPERIIEFAAESRGIKFAAETRSIRFGAENRDIEF